MAHTGRLKDGIKHGTEYFILRRTKRSNLHIHPLFHLK